MSLTVHLGGASPRPIYGPGDLNPVGPGATLLVSGEPDRERDFGHWAGAIGSAVLRGADVRRLP